MRAPEATRAHGFAGRMRLARDVFRVQAVQPATALWRAHEVAVVRERLRGEGRGLDLGCGDGTLATQLFAHLPAVRWTGLDIDAEDAELARRRGVHATVHVAPGERIPEPDGAFDLAFANSALEHFDELDGTLREVARILRPGGRFAFTVPVPAFRDLLLWRRILEAADARELADRYVAHVDRRLAHRNYLGAREWAERLARHGLRVTAVHPYLGGAAVAAWEALSNATGGVASLLAGGRHPRSVQQSMGLLRAEKPWVGDVAFALLSPLVAWTAWAEPRSTRAGCCYFEAVRE